MSDFTSFNLPPALMASLAAMQFTQPTPIQQQAIPLAMEGRDILGSAQTGTGKTGAFSIPMIARLLTNPRGTALVLTPTRELAMQVVTVIRQLLGKYSTIKTALLIGGESMPGQIQQLKARPRIYVGTPGRINDLLARGVLMLHDTNLLVLDETDRMLDMGFGIQIDKILKFLPPVRQTMMFSATLPPAIVKMSALYLQNPERIAVGDSNATATNVQQEIIRTNAAEKYPTLLRELTARDGSIIIFVKTKHGADRLAEKLTRENHRASAIHGDLAQSKRDRVIRQFRDRQMRILVATDIAARGLDISHIEHVINYDLPQCPEDYIHRIGRTARAGAEGCAVSLIAPEDREKWYAIDRLLNPEAAAKADAERKAARQGSGNGGGARTSAGAGGARNRSRNRNGAGRPGAGAGAAPANGSARPARPAGERTGGERVASERPHAERPHSERPRSDRPRTDRPAADDRPRRAFGAPRPGFSAAPHAGAEQRSGRRRSSAAVVHA